MKEMFGHSDKMTDLPRRSVEPSGAADGGMRVATRGIIAGTKVISNLGYRAVETLEIGDKVLTYDHGMQVITDIHRETFWQEGPDTDPADWPVIVPVGALANRVPLTLLQDQGILLESEAISDVFDLPWAVVPASSLEGLRGIERKAPLQEVELIAFSFAQDQVVYAEGGTLIHCPTQTAADDTLAVSASVYTVLTPSYAALVAECLSIEDGLLASEQHDQNVAA